MAQARRTTYGVEAVIQGGNAQCCTTKSATIHAHDQLDDGSAIFDFTGSGLELWGNLNAPKAVTQSAILYCLRCLVEKDIPLNHGCLNPVQIIIPQGTLLNPSETVIFVIFGVRSTLNAKTCFLDD